ncbi:glycosyltransferase [candidate division WWE3 bacterium]|nr:glycosyltransferase [candidate division WWE3 bacterium]
MKILYCPVHYWFDEIQGGSELAWSYNIAHRIALLNDTSIIVTGKTNLKDTPRYVIQEIQSSKTTLDMSPTNAVKFMFAYTVFMRRFLKNAKVDLIHHVLPFGIDRTFNIYSIMKREMPAPYVIGPLQSPLTVVDYDMDSSNLRDYGGVKSTSFAIKINFLSIFKKPLRYLSRLTLLKSDQIVTIDIKTRNLLIEAGIPSNKITIIPPGIDTNRFIPHDNSNEEIIIITTGNLIKRKAVEKLIWLVSQLVNINKPVKLMIVGDGPERNNLVKLVNQLGLCEKVIFVGHVSNDKIHEYYSKAHIFMSLSISESWGQMYLEALSSGLPIITVDNGGSASIVDHGINGYIFSQDDYQNLLHFLTLLVNNDELRNKMSIEARKKAIEKFDWDKSIIPQYLVLYNKLIK